MTAALLLTCLEDPAHNEYTTYRVTGAMWHHEGCLYFTDATGDRYKACQVDCKLQEAEPTRPGDDLRAEPQPWVYDDK